MLKIFILIANLFFCSSLLFAQMVLKYKTTLPNTTISLPLNGTVDVVVDWGDGSTKEKFTGAGGKTHTYVSLGLYTVNISGTLSWFGDVNTKIGSSLISVESWDGLGLINLSNAFCGATALTSVPKSLPSNITDLSGMFISASSFNQPIGTWNTGTVTNMSEMFVGAIAFNQPIGSWNTGNVVNMSNMFSESSSFNQPIGSWNTGMVTNMTFMFYKAISFNQPLGAWNTGMVTDMGVMFSSASSFNQPIGTWNTVSVTSMRSMFFNASSFNQPIGSWNTENVMDMRYMFSNAGSFNQPIGAWSTMNVWDMSQMFNNAWSFNQPIGTWDIRNVGRMTDMFDMTSLCTENYDNLLNGWAAQSIKTGVTFSAGRSMYSAASAAARGTLSSKFWSITDGGEGIDNSKCPPPTSVEDLQDNTLSQEIKVYPNPSAGMFIVSGKAALGIISMYNSVGKLIYEIKTNETQQSVNLASFEAGIYLVKTGNKSAKLVIE